MEGTPLTPELLRSMPIATRPGGKETRGRVMVVGGSRQVPGVIALCGEAALRAGAGKLQIAALDGWAMHLAFAVPEARVIPCRGEDEPGLDAMNAIAPFAQKLDAVVVGPGMLEARPAADLAAALAEEAKEASFVLDAAALVGFADRLDELLAFRGRAVLTPHPGEMAAFLGRDKAEIEADPGAVASETAKALGLVVALKQRTTHIAAPDGALYVHDGGFLGLATCGSGDVLAGVIGGLLARGAEPLQAALWGVWLHAAAGRALKERVGPLGFLARELAGEIPRLMGALS